MGGRGPERPCPVWRSLSDKEENSPCGIRAMVGPADTVSVAGQKAKATDAGFLSGHWRGLSEHRAVGAGRGAGR